MVINISKKFLFLIFIFVISFISAEFSLGNVSHVIETSYGLEQNLSGWINISFSNEQMNSVLKSSEDEQITLTDLLKQKLNSGFEYSCNPISCTSGYGAVQESTSKTFNLRAGESAIFGFKITGGTLTEMSRLNFNLISNNSETEKVPLSIDLLNDGQDEWEAYNSSGVYGEEGFGCYINYPDQFRAGIGPTNYCEKIELEQSPSVEIGAYVSYYTGSTNVPLELRIQEADGGRYQTCTVNATTTNELERVSCIPKNYDIREPGDYYVCIKTKNAADAGKYEINYEQDSACGLAGDTEGWDFEIFARQEKFASNTNIIFSDAELEKAGSPINDINSYVEDYINNMYDNCNVECIIPVKITAGVNQQITVSNLIMEYYISIFKRDNRFYGLEEQPPIINSGYQKLYFTESGFKAPNKEGDYEITFYLNDETLFDETIKVGGIPIIDYVTPIKTAIKYPTEFSAGVNSNINITSYKWNFGDGDIETTPEKKVTHTYESTGIYTMMLTVTNSAGRNSSKNFSITISPASEIVSSLLMKASADIVSLEEEINSFAGFKKTSIQNAFNIDDINDKLLTLKDSESKATLETDYESILEELLTLKIPASVGETSAGQGIIFYPEEENINLDILKEVGGGDYDSGRDEEYKEAILSWNVDNVNAVLSFNEISAIYEDYQEPAVRIFEVSITKTGEETAYLVIKDMENLIFEKDYSATDYDGYKYITLSDGTQNIVFSTTEDLNFLTLPIFISPSLSDITIAEWSAFDDSGKLKQWIIFTLVAIGVLFCAFVVYIVLQTWYKRKYESYLFKDRNSLYNLINYVKSSKENKMKDKDIENNLEKAGWTSEQRRYVMRKFVGKNTGLPEISIRKLLKEKELDKKTKASSQTNPKLRK